MSKKFNIFKVFIITLTIIVGCIHSASSFDSMIEFESRSDTGGGGSYFSNIDLCFDSGKVAYPWEYSAFNNICIPTILSKNHDSCADGGVGGLSFAANTARAAVYMTMLAAVPFGSLLAFLAVGVEFIIMMDLCTNAYIVAPHEYINLANDWVKCEEVGDDVVNNYVGSDGTRPLTSIDVPFYYHCDPFYDPTTGSTLTAGNAEDEFLIGRTWGYMGTASPYCAGNAANYARKDMIGKVVVHYISGWQRFLYGLDSRCNKGGEGSPTREEIILSTKDDENGKYNSPAHYYAYYRFISSVGKVQLCVVAPYTLLPIKIGCSYVPPPADDLELDNFLKAYLQDTRCYYFITGRTDLNALGRALRVEDEQSIAKQYVKDFLSSDMHVISTVVGCMQDLLTKVFINPSTVSSHGSKPFFQIVQERLKQIVYVTLILYVTLVGIKIISSAEIPQRGEWAMYLIKFGLVLYFATGNAWYEVKNGEKVGLYPALLAASSEIAGFFMGAQNANDPIGFCKYAVLNDNLLGEREIPIAYGVDGGIIGTPLEATKGFNEKIKMTVWDLVDCKLLNYLNLGSCKYTISGLIGVWIISAAILVSVKGFLLGIVSFIYCLMLLLVIFKFTHIFILSMFVITILVLVSPIILCFALFDYTKGIFQKWMQLIIGYILYPALLFAFIALMLATFDSVFFGDLDLVGNAGDVKKACAGVDSVYCTTYDAVGYDPCSANMGNINGTLTEKWDLGPLGTFTILKEPFAASYLDAMLKLMLFAFLFYLFLGSVSSFLAVLTGVQDLGSMAKGSLNIMAMAASAMSGKDKEGGGGEGGDSGKGGGSGEGGDSKQRDGGSNGPSASGSSGSSSASGGGSSSIGSSGSSGSSMSSAASSAATQG